MDLNAAAAGLAEASRLLSQSILSDSDEVIEVYYAFVRMAKAKFSGAMAAYRDHLQDQGISGVNQTPAA
ncbi:MAG: hypothetical protein ABUS51_06725 [Acidobacteriota bacterium]